MTHTASPYPVLWRCEPQTFERCDARRGDEGFVRGFRLALGEVERGSAGEKRNAAGTRRSRCPGSGLEEVPRRHAEVLSECCDEGRSRIVTTGQGNFSDSLPLL